MRSAVGPRRQRKSAFRSRPVAEAPIQYAYDDALNIATFTDLDGNHNFTYDGLNRLTQATHPVVSGLTNEAYTYDRVGNRKDPANASQWTYDNNNRITASSGLTYTFDAEGSLATRSDGATFTHDARSRLVQFVKGSTTAGYLDDPAGRRIRKIVNGTATWYLWDGTRLLGEYSGSGVRMERYGYLGRDLATTQVQDASGTYYAHADNLSAPRILTNSSGQIVWSAKYQAFGATIISAPTIVFNQRFPGQYFDVESADYYNFQRTYSPALGRYHQRDPIGLAGGANPYAYVGGNPISNIDPLGLWTRQIGISITLDLGGPLTFNVSGGIAWDGHGNVAPYVEGGGGASTSPDASIGLALHQSNGDSINDLNGPFVNVAAGGGWGAHATGDAFTGQGSQGQLVEGGGLTIGIGIGAGASTTITGTSVGVPISGTCP